MRVERIERLHHVILDGGLHDGLQRFTNCDGAPRGLPGQGDAWSGRADAVVLTLHGVSDGVRTRGGIIVGKARSAILAADTGLRDENPQVLRF